MYGYMYVFVSLIVYYTLCLCADYVKAYSRLGLSHFFMEQFEEAVEAYQRAVELEPDNKASADSLRQAQSKLAKARRQQVSSPGAGAGAGAPDLSALMGNPMMKQAMDKMGGSAGIANLMKDPQMMVSPSLLGYAMLCPPCIQWYRMYLCVCTYV